MFFVRLVVSGDKNGKHYQDTIPVSFGEGSITFGEVTGNQLGDGKGDIPPKFIDWPLNSRPQ